MASKVTNVTLNNGRTIPIFGLGTWKSKPGEVTQAVKDAIGAGYRHFDCAFGYSNEPEVGEALRDKMQDGTVKREDLFITSKLWNTHHSRAKVAENIKQTLTNLGLSYIDLYLVHWPLGYKEEGDLFPRDSDGKLLYSDVDYLETWQGMEDILKEGLALSIGVCNFNKDQLERVISEGSIVPVMNQVECHPYLTQAKLIDYCKSKGINITAYSPLGSPDRPWAKPGDIVIMEDPKLVAIAEKNKKTVAQLLIRFQVQRGVICIPKSVTKSRIESNIQIFDFELSEEDMKTIASFDCNGRLVHVNWLNDHPLYPFHTEF